MPTPTFFAALVVAATAEAAVPPMLETTWGQSGAWQSHTPVDAQGEATYPGCTTIATAQVLAYYRHQATASSAVAYTLDNDVYGPDIVDRFIEVELPETTHDFDAMALSDTESTGRIDAAGLFIYHVGVTLNAQFGDPSGSPATGKQLENAFRYQWGYNSVPRRQMSVISKSAFGYTDAEWAEVIRSELDAGRPVIHMALQADGDAGHAFVIDGYDDEGRVHVNWGWGGNGNGYYDPNTLEDPSGRRWNRDAMIFRGLEPVEGLAAQMRGTPEADTDLRWTGNGSLIAAASGTATGYGLTLDEAKVDRNGEGTATVFFQWEVDSADGERLRIDADDRGESATITYGTWGTRAEDRVYRDVTLPFVLDPRADGHDPVGQYFVVAVTHDSDGIIAAEATTEAADSTRSTSAGPLPVDGHTWNGNGSIIGYTSGSATGYGLTHDEAAIHPSDTAPVVFFQWEIDGSDGDTLLLDAPGAGSAVVSYGPWNGDRRDDVTRSVSLPHTLDPAADGLSAADGQYYVIKVAFDANPTKTLPVTATASR